MPEHTMTSPPPIADAQDVCASDPNFAVIFAFCERFGDSCGVTIPTFQELQEMLEKTDEVPETLINLHVKLLRKSKKIVYLDKWEKAILKFCQGYSVPECWKLEHYGYKGISVQLKLRILKALIEVQFDHNVKFKAEINKYESSMLRSQPLGWDKSGAAYWVQFDRSYNIRVYKDDIDEDSWKMVAKDRSTLVNLINELSGIKDTSLTTSPVIENEDECSINDSSDFKSDINIFDPREYSLEKPIDLKRETDEDKSLDKINIPIVGDVIEESVMIVKGEGSGLECDTGNPDETNTQNETLKNEDVKKPKLWTIETICSSSKEVKEDISVPKTGFFFGDDSVPCFNNVSNGENSQLIKEKFEGSSSKENYEDLTTNNKLNEDLTTDKKLYEDLTTNKKLDEDLTTNKKLDEKFTVNEKLNEEFTVNEKLDEEFTVNKKLDEEVAINKKLNEKFIANKNLVDEHAINEKINEELVVNKTLEVDLEKNIKLNKDLTKNEKMDKVVDSTTMNSIESLDKGCSSKSTEDLSVNKTSKQSVFNIKVHEEEVQITERKANEVFTKSEFTVKDDAHIVNSNIPVLKSSCNDKSITFDETEQNNIVNKYEENEKIECKNNDYQSGIQLTHANSVTNVDVHSVNQEIFGIKSLENRKEETEQQLENDQQLVTKLEDNTDVHIHESPIKTNKQSTSDGSPSDKIEKVVKNCDNVNPIKSLLSTANQCIDINEQNIDTVEQNSSTLDNIEFSNEGNLNVIIDNKISANEFNINDNNKEIVSLEVQSNESNTQITKNVDEDIQTIDDLNTNATYLKHDVNLHTESENSIKSEIECSGENVNSKADDQTLIDNVNLYPTTSKQIDDEQNYKKPNLTLHNISNIIETNKSVDDTIVTKQSINTCNMEINKQEYYQIKNKNNNGASIQEKTESVANITQNIFNNKHSLDKILQKSVEIKDISECPSHKKNFMEEFKLENQPESSNFEVEKDNVCMVKSEKNIKELKTKNLDSTVEKNNSEFIENKNKIVLANPKVQKKNNSTNIASENHKFHDEIPTISMEDKIIPTVGKIKHNSSKRDKTKLISTEHKTDVSYEEEPKNESYKKDNFPPNVSVQKSILAVEMDENNANEIVQGENCMTDSIKNDDNSKNNDNFDEDINQECKINKKDNDPIDNNTLQTSEIDSSPVYEDMYESAGDPNEDTFIESFKEELDDSGMIDKTVEENEKKSGEEDLEETPKKKGRPGRKKGKRGRTKKNTTVKQESTSNNEEKIKKPYKPRQKKVVTIAEEVTVFPEPASDDNVRRSRRIAEIKIKEQFIPSTQYDDIDIPVKISKKKDKGVKKVSTPTKKMETAEESDDDEEDPISKKYKKRKRKGKPDSLKKINMVNPWNVDSESSSSENNVELFEDYDHEEEDEILRPGIEPNISDHEFSPESDINEDENYLPEKRARTAHKKDQDEELKDDMPCQNCKKSDQPEWILLCDTCNQGWHASCLRPPLMVIPDGDWYCPTCRHSSLLDSLKEVLKKYDEESKKRENEELRRKRLAYVGISLQNVISSKTEEVKTPKLPTVHDSSEEDEEESESESYDSEPLYQLRARRQTNVSYRFNDYDDMINEAILEETGVNESVTKKSIEAKADKNDNDENTDSENVDDNKNRDDSPIAPALLHLRGRKKSKKLTNLDISSDDGSDEDFKGPSDGDDDYEEEFSEYSDDSVQNRAQPTRRSVRNRKTVVDPDFINDDSSEDGDKRPNKKRSRPWSESSNSEGEDFTWGKRKNKRANIPSSSSLSFKSHKGSKRQRNSNDSVQKSKKYKIKYGMESDSDSYGQSKRRTRGRQITYAESDESEEEVQTKKRKVMSDEEDEYVLNDEELAAENDDHHLEVDEEDAMASNDEKDDDEDAEEEEEEGEEEEEEEEVADEEEGDDEEQKVSDSKPAAVQQVAEKLPTSAAAAVAQSVIRELPPPPLVSTVPPTAAADYAQQRLLPLAAGATTVRTSVLAPTPLPPVDPADKRKRPSPHQLNESPLPNPSVDYGGSGYPYPSDATKVVASTVVPPSQPVHQAAFNRPPVVAAAVGAAGFKPMAGVPPPGCFPAQYRVPNKMAPTGYVAPQVRQLYQSVPPPPQQSRATYSQYPIDYAATGTPLPSPLPPTVSFRNVVVAPPPSHEHLPMQPLPPPVTQQQSVVISGDSEFGGLVSYFSSQQEDDFDT